MLCLVCLLLLAIRLVYPSFIAPGNIIVKNLPLVESKADSTFQLVANESPTASLFVFNPNTITRDNLLKLGLNNKTVTTFLKFRSKGFVFKQKEDLKKVYGINNALYEKLQPYIYIEKSQPKEITAQKTNAVVQLVELNSADSVQLLEIKGVGPSFAKRILKYRNMLGGFMDKVQLKEVYGFTEEMYENISSQVKVEGAVKKININSDDFKIVNRHPYIGYEITKLIFNQRKKQPLSENDLKAIINDENMYGKLLPYINFN